MNMRDLDLNLLLVFEAIYSTGNISRAAEQLDMSQPALSNALTRLRKQLDDPLFVRSGNGVVPTSRAEQIIAPVREALSTIRLSIAPEAGFDPLTSERRFRLIIADPLEQIVMTKLVGALGTRSRISFELQPPQSTQIEDALQSRLTDLAVFLTPPNDSEFVSHPLCPVDTVMLARKDHPRISDVQAMPDLAGEGFAMLALAPGKLANSEKVTIWQRLNLNVVCSVYKVSSIAQIVAQSDLLGIVPRLYAQQFAEIYGLRVIDLPVKLSNQYFHMIWHKRSEADEGHQWLRAAVRESVEAAHAALS